MKWRIIICTINDEYNYRQCNEILKYWNVYRLFDVEDTSWESTHEFIDLRDTDDEHPECNQVSQVKCELLFRKMDFF